VAGVDAKRQAVRVCARHLRDEAPISRAKVE
jgi:hypothetical protein